MSKLRVWWIPQIGIGQTFYIPVETVEDGKKMMDILAAYDLFQLQNNVKPDYSNVGGLQMWDEEEKEWCDWFMETENDFFEDEKSEELKKFNKELYTQIDYNKIQRMIS